MAKNEMIKNGEDISLNDKLYEIKSDLFRWW